MASSAAVRVAVRLADMKHRCYETKMIRNSGDSRLVGRDDELRRLWQALETHPGVLLAGARRVGKSELLKEMVRRPGAGWVAVRIDLEGLDDVAGAAVRVERDLEEAGLRLGLADTVDVKLRVAGAEVATRAPASDDPWVRIEDLVRRARPEEKRLVLLLDEVPWWLDALRAHGDDVARTALARLRHMRQSDDRVRMVLTGSVGLAGLARAIEASAEINDLFPMNLGPLPRADAETLFEATLVGLGSEAFGTAKTRAWRETGGVPHWLILLAQQLAEQAAVEEKDVTAAVDRLLSPAMRNLFDDEGRRHLPKRHGAERAARMRAILHAAAPEPGGVPASLLVTVALGAGEPTRDGAEELVYLLMDEFYLEAVDDRFRFANPLLRRWWLRYGEGR